MTVFELWDLATANILASYESETAALAFIRRIADAHGNDTLKTWELVYVHDDEDAEPIARGSALVAMATRSEGSPA